MNFKILKLKKSNVKSCDIFLPGSKSISNRVLLMASIAKGNIKIKNLLFSDDTNVMIDVLKKLDVPISYNQENKECFIKGSPDIFFNKKVDLYVGNAGTVIRPLTAILAFNRGIFKLHGTKRMHERPIKDLIDSLNSIGAKITYSNNNGYPPLNIIGSKIKKNIAKIKGNISSQFLTSLLIASSILSKNEMHSDFTIEVTDKLISKPYVAITVKLLELFSIKISEENNNYSIKKNQTLINPKEFFVEGDASSASYFFAAAAISGKLLKIHGLGKNSIQGDIKFLEILKKMGADVKINQDSIEVSSSSKLKNIDIDLNHIPDAAMTVAILSLYANGISTLRNIGSWRVKETDRLAAMSKELTKLGAKVTEGKDFIKIEPPIIFNNATINTYDDHRMAMCFSLVSINSYYKNGAEIIINDPDCVSKTFPNYFEIFESILE